MCYGDACHLQPLPQLASSPKCDEDSSSDQLLCVAVLPRYGTAVPVSPYLGVTVTPSAADAPPGNRVCPKKMPPTPIVHVHLDVGDKVNSPSASAFMASDVPHEVL
jgi:hypothetical protein